MVESRLLISRFYTISLCSLKRDTPSSFRSSGGLFRSATRTTCTLSQFEIISPWAFTSLLTASIPTPCILDRTASNLSNELFPVFLLSYSSYFSIFSRILLDLCPQLSNRCLINLKLKGKSWRIIDQLQMVLLCHLYRLSLTNLPPKSLAIRNLGIDFWFVVWFKCHKKAITKTPFSYPCDIAQIQPTQSLRDAETVMHSFVFYRLVNGNAPLSVLISIAVVSLQLFQNAAARILTITTKFTPWPLFTGYPGRPELILRFLFELIRPSVLSFLSSGHHIWWPSLFPRHCSPFVPSRQQRKGWLQRICLACASSLH